MPSSWSALKKLSQSGDFPKSTNVCRKSVPQKRQVAAACMGWSWLTASCNLCITVDIRFPYRENNFRSCQEANLLFTGCLPDPRCVQGACQARNQQFHRVINAITAPKPGRRIQLHRSSLRVWRNLCALFLERQGGDGARLCTKTCKIFSAMWARFSGGSPDRCEELVFKQIKKRIVLCIEHATVIAYLAGYPGYKAPALGFKREESLFH
jgi:hypothetical protein